MKKRLFILISVIIVFLIVAIVLALTFNHKEEVVYDEIILDGYTFKLNSYYNYIYDDEEKYGYLDCDEIYSSYIFISDKSYSSLINSTSSYTNSSSDELDSSVEELKFNTYSGFINIKTVNYRDVDKDYYLVVILVELEENKTLVFQYETEIGNDNDAILNDIKEGLKDI